MRCQGGSIYPLGYRRVEESRPIHMDDQSALVGIFLQLAQVFRRLEGAAAAIVGIFNRNQLRLGLVNIVA